MSLSNSVFIRFSSIFAFFTGSVGSSEFDEDLLRPSEIKFVKYSILNFCHKVYQRECNTYILLQKVMLDKIEN